MTKEEEGEQMEKIYSKHCFIKAKSDNKVFCSKCGEPLSLTDEYNRRKHAKACGFTVYDEIKCFTEKEAHAFSLHSKAGYMVLSVYAPVLVYHPYFERRVLSGKWKKVYQASYAVNGKTIDEKGMYHIGYWAHLIKQDALICLNEESPVEVVRRCFNYAVYEYKDFEMFTRIHLNKGYANQIYISAEEALQLVTTPLSYNAFRNIDLHATRNRWVNEKQIYGKLLTLQNGELVWRLELVDERRGYKQDERKISVLVSENYIYFRDAFEVENLFKIHAHCHLDAEEVEKFDKKYPRVGLKQFIENGGENVMIPLAAPNFDHVLELIYKSSVPVAEGLYSCKSRYNANGKNLKEIFNGLSPKNIRKVDKSAMEEDNVFEVLNAVQRYDVSLLNELEKINDNVIRFFSDTIYRKENGRTPLMDYEAISRKRFVKIIKEFEASENPYWLIRDHMFMAGNVRNGHTQYLRNGIFEEHMNRIAAFENHQMYTTKEQEEKFLYRIQSTEYQRLSTVHSEHMDNFEKDSYVVLVPKTVDELERESQELHHCVRWYFSMIADGYTRIYFLRLKKQMDMPFATIEVKNNEIIQLKGKFNSKVNGYAQNFVKKWADYMNLSVRTNDIAG